jgi:transposase
MNHGAYSKDLRKRVIEYVLSGHSCEAAGAHFQVSESSAIKWTRRYRETGEIEARPLGGDRRSRAIEAASDTILKIVKARPDITLMDLKAELDEQNLIFSKSALDRFLNRHGQTFKKRQPTRKSKAVQTS